MKELFLSHWDSLLLLRLFLTCDSLCEWIERALLAAKETWAREAGVEDYMKS